MNAPLGSFGGRPWRGLVRRQIEVLDGPLLVILPPFASILPPFAWQFAGLLLVLLPIAGPGHS